VCVCAVDHERFGMMMGMEAGTANVK
jgi:hypothetical protein